MPLVQNVVANPCLRVSQTRAAGVPKQRPLLTSPPVSLSHASGPGTVVSISCQPGPRDWGWLAPGELEPGRNVPLDCTQDGAFLACCPVSQQPGPVPFPLGPGCSRIVSSSATKGRTAQTRPLSLLVVTAEPLQPRESSQQPGSRGGSERSGSRSPCPSFTFSGHRRACWG